MNIVQILDSKGKRRVGLVSAEKIILLKKVARTTELAKLALKDGVKLLERRKIPRPPVQRKIMPRRSRKTACCRRWTMKIPPIA